MDEHNVARQPGELAATERGLEIIADARAKVADLIPLAADGVNVGELLFVAYLRGAQTAHQDSRAKYSEAFGVAA